MGFGYPLSLPGAYKPEEWSKWLSLYKWAVVHDRWAGKYVKVYFEAGMGKYRFYDVE